MSTSNLWSTWRMFGSNTMRRTWGNMKWLSYAFSPFPLCAKWGKMLTFFREWLQTFSPKNPYFKETQIKKRVTVTPPKPSEDTPSPSPHDLDAPLFLLPASPITWTSDDHNLIKKAPKVNVLELEQFDEFDGSTGSFFNWFLQEGEDDIGLAEYLLEWWSHATESVLILFHPSHL